MMCWCISFPGSNLLIRNPRGCFVYRVHHFAVLYATASLRSNILDSCSSVEWLSHQRW